MRHSQVSIPLTSRMISTQRLNRSKIYTQILSFPQNPSLTDHNSDSTRLFWFSVQSGKNGYGWLTGKFFLEKKEKQLDFCVRNLYNFKLC